MTHALVSSCIEYSQVRLDLAYSMLLLASEGGMEAY